MSKLVISHSLPDDGFVRDLRWTLAEFKQQTWREFVGGMFLA